MPFECCVWQASLAQQPFPAQQFPPEPGVPHSRGFAAGHGQLPAVHVAPVPHAYPHPPQLASSVTVFTQAPLQTVSVPGQTQLRLVHVAPVAQTVAHPPQLDGSLARSTQVEPHVSGSAVGHSQVPPTHTSFVSGQLVSQAPQCAASVWRFVQNVPQSSA